MNLLYIEITENLIDEKRNQKSLKAFAKNVKATFSDSQLKRVLRIVATIANRPMSLTFGLSETPLVVETEPTANGKRRGLWSFSVYTDDESQLTTKQVATMKRELREYFKDYNENTKLTFDTLTI